MAGRNCHNEGIVFTIEFKAGADEYLVNDKEQVWDYALDLKNFHEESRNLVIVPILVATEAKEYSNSFLCQYDDNVYNPLFSNSQTLLGIIKAILEHEPEHPSIELRTQCGRNLGSISRPRAFSPAAGV